MRGSWVLESVLSGSPFTLDDSFLVQGQRRPFEATSCSLSSIPSSSSSVTFFGTGTSYTAIPKEFPNFVPLEGYPLITSSERSSSGVNA